MADLTRILRTVGLPAVVLALAMVATGCGTTMRDLPIPGTGVSGETIDVIAEFDDAANLAKGAPVKVNGVDSGKVTEIEVEDFTAIVTMTIREDAEVRKGATARLRYTTPLGEIFVDVRNPDRGTVLADQAVLSLKRTDTAPSVENALASASLLINGGGLEQLQTVTEELNTILVGNEEEIKSLLRNANDFLVQANATTGAIDRVLTSLNSVSGTLAEREELFNRVIKDIRPAARVLRETTPEFTTLLQEIEKFSGVANDTVEATRTQLLALLREVQPVLAELSANSGRMNRMLKSITTGGSIVDRVADGDYLSLGVDLDMEGVNLEGGLAGTVGGLLEVLGLEALADELGILEELDIVPDDVPVVGGLLRGAPAASSPAGFGRLAGGN